MLEKIFNAHPRSLGQTYLEHQRTAFGYAWRLMAAGIAAALHGLVPCTFETTASRVVDELHHRLLVRSGGSPSRRELG